MLEDWGAVWNRHGVRYEGGEGMALALSCILQHQPTGNVAAQYIVVTSGGS